MEDAKNMITEINNDPSTIILPNEETGSVQFFNANSLRFFVSIHEKSRKVTDNEQYNKQQQ